MKSLYEEFQLKSFDDWANTYNKLYGEKLMQLHPSEVFLRLSESGGIIAENVRRDRYQEVLSGLAVCIYSLVSVYNRIAYDPQFENLFMSEESHGLNRSIFEKFPHRCPHCGGEHCICAIVYSDSENRTPEEKEAMKQEVQKILETARANEKPPERLDEFKDLFRGIYGQGHQYMTIDIICFHLLEEIGELAQALRNLTSCQSASSIRVLRDEFMSEIADIVSWIFALWRNILISSQKCLQGYWSHENRSAFRIPNESCDGLRIP